MTTETDIYGMSAEERAAFERWINVHHLSMRIKDGRYWSEWLHIKAFTWAACTKLYREQLYTAMMDLEIARSGRENALDRLDTAHAMSRDVWERMKALETQLEQLRSKCNDLDIEI